MPTRNIRRTATVQGPVTPTVAPIYVDSDDNILKMIPAGSGTTEVQIIDAASTQAITGVKTFTSPVFTAPSGATSTGIMITKSVRFVENGAATSYTGTIPIPAGAIIHDIKVIAEALWNGTSATGKVGDTASSNGFFTGINLKAADLLVNEVLSTMHSTLWGGKEGAYLVAASGSRGPTTTNFGTYYAAGSNLIMVVTPGAADGSTGRTVFSVTYSVGEVIAQVTV